MRFYIYKTTNTLNGMYYIGLHAVDCEMSECKYIGSGTRLKNAIKEFGKENFKCEVLEELDTREKMILREKEIVTPELINDKQCYNMSAGGMRSKGGYGFKKKNIQRNRKKPKGTKDD